MPRCLGWASPITRKPPPRSISCRSGSTASSAFGIILGADRLCRLGLGPAAQRRPRAWTVTLPGGPLTLLQIAIGIVDLGFCALAMYVLVPDEPQSRLCRGRRDLRLGHAAGVCQPFAGRAWRFDAACWSALWQMDREDLLAGLLLFRVLYYIGPFVVSVILLTLRRLLSARHRAPTPTGGQVPTPNRRGMWPLLCARARRHGHLTVRRGLRQRSAFKRKPAPDLIRGGNRFASRKRVRIKI